MKRFWTTVTVEQSGIRLDGRPVRTPARAELVLPTPALADAVADEWRAVGKEVDPRDMPLTGLANAAIDQVKDGFADPLVLYAETDLLCYRAAEPPPLAERQATVWDPLLDWARTRYDVTFTVTAGIVHVAQPPATVARLATAVTARSPFELAALSTLVTISGSLVIALMVAEAALSPDEAFAAAHLDELWQVELWGEDTLGEQARVARAADFANAARFLHLVRD